MCVEFIVVTATEDIMEWYSVVYVEFIVFRATVDIVQCYCVVCGVIVVTATVGIVQWYCVLCGVYCGYSNSRCSAMVLCCVWSLLWLQQQ